MPPSPLILHLTVLSFLLSIGHVLAATASNITFTLPDPVFVGIPYNVTWHRQGKDPATFYVQSFSIGDIVPLTPQDTVLVDSKGALSGGVQFMQCTAGRRAMKVLDASNQVQVLAESVQYSVLDSNSPQATNCPSNSTSNSTAPSGGQTNKPSSSQQPGPVEVESHSTLGTGAIVGIVIVVVVVVASVVVAILFWRRNKARREREAGLSYDADAMVKQRDMSPDLIPRHPTLPPENTGSVTSDTTGTQSLAQRVADLELNLQRNEMATNGELAELRGALGELRDDPYSIFGSDNVSPPAYHPNRSSRES